MLIELDPVDRITADAVGTPGSRVFYLQARKGDRIVTLILEKQQVQLLAASVVEILARIGKETGEGPPEEQMGLDEPVLPEWRTGRLSIGYEEQRDMLMLEAEELLTQEEEEQATGEGPADALSAIGPELTVEQEAEEEAAEPEEAEETRDAARARFWATREQMLSLARHGALICAAGRPLCPLCRNPLDPEGHDCPALNGHRQLGES